MSHCWCLLLLQRSPHQSALRLIAPKVTAQCLIIRSFLMVNSTCILFGQVIARAGWGVADDPVNIGLMRCYDKTHKPGDRWCAASQVVPTEHRDRSGQVLTGSAYSLLSWRRFWFTPKHHRAFEMKKFINVKRFTCIRSYQVNFNTYGFIFLLIDHFGKEEATLSRGTWHLSGPGVHYWIKMCIEQENPWCGSNRR